MEIDDLIFVAVVMFSMVPVVLLAAVHHRKVNSKYLLLGFGYMVADFLLTISGLAVQSKFHHGFNWLGKLLSLGLTIAILWRCKDLRSEFGLALKQKKPRAGITAAVLLVAIFVWHGSTSLHSPFKLETCLYQATMPGLSEEFCFRGVAMWLLSRALGTAFEIKGQTVSWGVIATTVAFGMGHAIAVLHGHVHITWVAFAFTGLIGAALAAIRVVSGSLLLPVIAHNGINVSETVIPMLHLS